MTSAVWVTGASRGIGRALVESVPWVDCTVLGVSRTSPASPQVRGGARYEHLLADLSTPDSWMAVVQSIRDTLTTLTVDRAVFLHCAATVGPIGFAGEVDSEEYRQSVVLNSVAPQILGHGFIHALREAPHALEGTLTLLSSGTSSGIYEGWSSYKAGKAAVDEWVRITAAEEAGRHGGVRVLSIAPGVVATGMQEEIRLAAEHDFPRVAKFVDMHKQASLVDPVAVAAQIWKIVTSTEDVGPVIDLRELPLGNERDES